MADQLQELVATLIKLKERYPHWRFGQLVCNVAAWSGETAPGEIWDVSDEAMLTAAKAHLSQNESRPGGQHKAAG